MAVLGSYYGGGAPTEFESADNLEGGSTAIGAGIGAIVGGMVGSLVGGDDYDAYKDYLTAVARSDARLPDDQLNLPKEELLAKILAAGWVPIFCGDLETVRTNVLREFGSRGWQGKGWWQRYHKGLGTYTHWFGVTFNFANAPQAVVQQANLDGTKANSLLVNAKVWMRPQGTENYNEMIRLAAGAVVLAQRAAQPPAPLTPPGEGQMGGAARRPWYKKWWIWALVGGVTVTAGIGGYMLIRRLRRKAAPALPALPATTQGFGRWPSK